MKIKLLGTLAIITILASCSSSKKAVTESKKVTETKAEVQLTAEQSEGKLLFESKCGRCHDLPKANHYTKEKWLPIVNSMAKRAKMSESDADLVYNYLTTSI